MTNVTPAQFIAPVHAAVIHEALTAAARENVSRIGEAWEALYKAMGQVRDDNSPTQDDDLQIAARRVMRDPAAFNRNEVIDAMEDLRDAGRKADQLASAKEAIRPFRRAS